MVTLAATALEGGGTPSYTLEQHHGSPPLPLGGGALSDTAGQHHGGPPASDVDVVSGTREEGGLAPWRRGEPQSGDQHSRRRRKRCHGQGLRGGGEGITLSKTIWMQQKTFGSNSALPQLKR